MAFGEILLADTACSLGLARWLHLARSGSQSQRANWVMLPARGASRAIILISLIQFEITGYHCNVIGSQRCDLFTNRTIFCSKSHLFFSQ